MEDSSANGSARPAPGESGLSSAEAADRLRRHGRNEVPDEPPHALRSFLGKFWGPSPWMIELVAVVSAVLGRTADVALALALLVANAVLSFFQERRASAAVDALRSRLRVNSRVLRDGSWGTIPAAEVVPGDVVRIRAGDFVPADATVLAGDVAIDQSVLTGESLEVAGGPGATVHAGALVRRGECTALVERTGLDTYFGRTTHLVQTARPRLHVEEIVTRVVRWLFAITAILTALVLAAELVRGLPVLDTLPLLLLLLLGALPVALPVMFTVSMAVGATELSQRGVLVTHLSAAEDAATMDVLCADKTGTITLNRLRVASVHAREGYTEDEVIRLGALASEESDQDPIDLALLAAGRERRSAGPPGPRTAFRPFSAETRRTEATFEIPGGALTAVKGALRTLVEACHVPEAAARELESRASAAAAMGRRTIAIARALPGESLRLAGLVMLEDPARPDSRELIEDLRTLGVGVKMLTGDALPVAREMAREVGLGEVEPVAPLREDLARDPAAAAARAASAGGFAEVLPEDKFGVVRALQGSGHVVGMTGDGVNDAPALRQAEVGIAVRSSADVAKGSASVVLTTDGLVGIVEMVRSGRKVHQRVLTWIVNKVSRTLQTSAFVSVAFLATGRFVVSSLGMVLLLFLTDFGKISLATDRVTGSGRPETWRIGGWVRIAVVLGVLMVLETLGLLAAAWTPLGLGRDLAALQTFSFQALLYFALFSIVSQRERRSFWSSRPSPTLAIALGGAAVAGALLPLANLPGLHAIPAWQTGIVVAAAAIASLGVNDVVKTLLIRRAGLAPLPAEPVPPHRGGVTAPAQPAAPR